jgi:hypothetical protein
LQLLLALHHSLSPVSPWTQGRENASEASETGVLQRWKTGACFPPTWYRSDMRECQIPSSLFIPVGPLPWKVSGPPPKIAVHLTWERQDSRQTVTAFRRSILPLIVEDGVTKVVPDKQDGRRVRAVFEVARWSPLD